MMTYMQMTFSGVISWAPVSSLVLLQCIDITMNRVLVGISTVIISLHSHHQKTKNDSHPFAPSSTLYEALHPNPLKN